MSSRTSPFLSTCFIQKAEKDAVAWDGMGWARMGRYRPREQASEVSCFVLFGTAWNRWIFDLLNH